MPHRLSPKVRCDQCGKGFRSESGFRWHRDNMHTGKATPKRLTKSMPVQGVLLFRIAHHLGILDPDEVRLFKALIAHNTATLAQAMRERPG